MTTDSAAKLQELAFCKAGIKRTLDAWRQCGILLDRVNEEELWRYDKQSNGESYRSFNQWCRLEFGIRRQNVYAKMNAAAVAETLDPGGDLFDDQQSVDDFAEMERKTTAKLRAELDAMTAEELLKARQEAQKKHLHPGEDQEELKRQKKHKGALAAVRRLRKYLNGNAEAIGLLERVEHLVCQISERMAA